ncbi:PC-esterase domain-containing protein 1A [Thalassophryne amazonica]|uniref:PC-esterase domain-containing protein 1A n=1 Tax=Thalassophryne amazonica TaxID=390379 RepID=UPI0014726187|nr:PC-esterase domain-containing protein 1A [Thalassophryne amazonica]
MKCVTHQQARMLLHNKFVVVLGDSIQRSVYKDLVLLLQKEKYLSVKQLKRKGEMNFEQDCLVEGGCLNQMHNGTKYQEVRQYQSDHHLVRFYFLTRVYSEYMQSVMEDFRQGLKPDVLIINSCVWDISRYNSSWNDDYKENLHKFFCELQEVLPEETLVIWSLAMPLGERIRGGFLVPEIEYMVPRLRNDVIEANFDSGILAAAYGVDVLDSHFHFRFSLQHRSNDGVHWNAFAHRKITSLLLQHVAEAWGVVMHCSVTTVECINVSDHQPAYRNANRHAGWYPSEDDNRDEFSRDGFPAFGYLSFEEEQQQQPWHRHPQTAPAYPPIYHPQRHPSFHDDSWVSSGKNRLSADT